VSAHTQAVAPTAPGQIRTGRGKPTKNKGRVKRGSKGEESSVEKTMKTSTNGEKTMLSIHKVVVDFRRFFSVNDAKSMVTANCSLEMN